MTPQAVDYFLFDNQTWSPVRGRDWGVKVASGVLATRRDLEGVFVGYCNATSAQAQPRDFGYALGGVRPRGGYSSGYLVCVTIETPDRAGRPSWAVVGLWFEATQDLSVALVNVDFERAARSVLEAPEPKPTEASLPLSPISWVNPQHEAPLVARPAYTTHPPIERFVPGSSDRKVRSLLAQYLESGQTPPSILGITGFRHQDRSRFTGFELVLAQPVDERAEAAMERARREQPPLSSRPHSPPLPAPLPDRVVESVSRPSPRPIGWSAPTPTSRGALVWGPILALVAIALVLVWQGARVKPKLPKELSSTKDCGAGDQPPRPNSASVQGTSRPLPPMTLPPEAGLSPGEISRPVEFEFEQHVVGLFEALEPDALRNTRSFKILISVPVSRTHQAKKDELSRAFGRLLAARELVLRGDGDSLAYFAKAGGRRLDAEAQRGGIHRVLDEYQHNSAACEPLRDAFAFEFEDPRSVVAQWCEAAGELNRLAQERGVL